MAEKTLSIKLTLNDKQFMSRMRKTSAFMKKWGKSFAKTGESLTKNVTVPILGLGAAAVKLASDFEESLNKVNVAFGESSADVQAFAKTTLKSFGIAEGSALEMASLFGDMATAMGLSQDEAAGMSTSLVGLAGDLASFKNIGIEQAQTALAGIFTGETESLKKLGIVMTEANLKSFALSKGMDGNVKSMTQAQKVALRYSFIMESTANAQGDFARTSDGFANQFRVLQESMKQLGEQFGKILLPLATRMVVKLQNFATAISNLTTEQKENIVQFAKYAAIIGPLLLVLGKFSIAISSIIKNMRILTAIAITNPFVLLGTAVTALVGIMGFAILDTEKFIKTALQMGKVGKFIAKVVLGALSAISPKYQAYFAVIDEVGESLDEQEKKLKDSTKEIDSNKDAVDKLNTSLQNLNKTQQGGEAPPSRTTITGKKVGPLAQEKGFGDIPKKLEAVAAIEPDGLESFNDAFNRFGEEFTATLMNTFSEITNIIGKVGALFSQLHNKRMIELDNERAKEIENINNSMRNEESKEAAINNINQKFDKKKEEADKKQAKRAKAMAILEATVATAAAVVKALPNIPLSIATGIIGAAQVATIASTSIPAFAEGGIVSGPTIGLMGEYAGANTNPEVIAPLNKLKDMIGGQGQKIIVEGVISGEDIYLTNKRQEKIQGR
tara:strand:+ start:168 stop:2180 length:2013 start_codon:yes stop_codon:yes gene_type:complete